MTKVTGRKKGAVGRPPLLLMDWTGSDRTAQWKRDSSSESKVKV